MEKFATTTGSGAGLHAFGDESVWLAEDGATRTYTIAAVFLAPSDLVDMRMSLTRLNRDRRAKLHWRRQTPAARLATTRAIAELSFSGVAISHEAKPSRREEEQRRLCLNLLMGTLIDNGCVGVCLESRGRKLDRNDSLSWQEIQSSRQQHRQVTLSHTPGPSEPLLWLPDIVCGAFRSAVLGDAQAWNMLAHKVNHIALESKGRPGGPAM